MNKRMYLSPSVNLSTMPTQDIIMKSLLFADEGMGNMEEWNDFINPEN